jgi:hypothetical protein
LNQHGEANEYYKKEDCMLRNPIIFALIVISIVMFAVFPALAITYGELDGNNHPNVGVVIYQDNGGKAVLCSGTLISPTVFLTAGHCTAYLSALGIDPSKVWVSFDQVFDPISSILISVNTYYTNPAYYSRSFANQSDLAVIILGNEPDGITPATLPALGLLDELGPRGLRNQQFTTVGYGDIQPSIGHGPPIFNSSGIRRVATSAFNALNKHWLRLSGNNATDNGGTCFGDSGGPNFLVDGSGEILVAITVTGDAMCLATNVDYRLDTAAARSFLKEFIELP